MKDITAGTCDHVGCECLATVDMVVIAPTPVPRQIARLSIYLYLCEQHARECELPPALLSAEEIESVSEALELYGFGRPDFSAAFWEYAPVPECIAVKPN